ncbi:MAG: hypothetical protein JWN94_3837 [Betaproteobacteria bacterium]|nr:hypothetical protein [Betaproteobacteria bacterium]
MTVERIYGRPKRLVRDLIRSRPSILRTLALSVLLTALLAPTVAAAADRPSSAGESIYRHGILGAGEPLEGTREAGMRMQGAAAACVNCHRRSGLGSKEGGIMIPPITGRYLFNPRAPNTDDMNVPYVQSMRGDRNPYTEATLARAIRDGLDSDGRPMNYLMPRFALNDGDMASLIGWLKQRDQRKVRGVTDAVLHFATIITPDADPVKRRGMLDVMEKYFADKNARQLGATPRLRSSNKTAFSKVMFMVNRRWELHVWELTGPESTWQAQLRRYMSAEPVFAVVSGIGGKTWQPVHAFCEEAAVPCLFPNVDVPVEADGGFYSLYFSRGVLLEAELIANTIGEAPDRERIKAVKQIYRAGDIGASAATAFAAALKRYNIPVTSRVLEPGENVSAALGKTAATDAIVLWLRPQDIAALGNSQPVTASAYMSGLMGGLERSPLPANWRERMHVAYPVDLPEKRRYRVDYAYGWFAVRKIAVVADQVQADTFLACGLLAETVGHMVDTFVPEYLIERMQDMIERRIVTGYYPRLTLAAGQPFASKGGYMVRFAEPAGTRVVALGNWTTP